MERPRVDPPRPNGMARVESSEGFLSPINVSAHGPALAIAQMAEKADGNGHLHKSR